MGKSDLKKQGHTLFLPDRFARQEFGHDTVLSSQPPQPLAPRWHPPSSSIGSGDCAYERMPT